METKKVKSLSISVKSFITSIAIILSIMILAFVFAKVLPAGTFAREIVDGTEKILIDAEHPFGIYSTVEKDFPFWKFLLSPFLALFSDGGLMIIAIIIFLLVIGGIFEVLFQQGIIDYLLKKVVAKFYNKRFALLAILSFMFMTLASTAGCFEELIPMIPFVVAIMVSFGWDIFTGVACILVSSACGYAAGVINPFGTGVAQSVAGIDAFSGISLRLLTFVILYAILVTFLILHAKKIEKKNGVVKEVNEKFESNKTLDKTLIAFGSVVGVGLLFIISSTFIPALQDYTLYVFALCFLVGGIVASVVSGISASKFFKAFGKGVVSMLPAVLMILLASSIKYILVESSRLDTILKFFIEATDGMSNYVVILFVYLIVLLFELVVPSGSAKAFLLIPLVMPIASVVNIGPNLIILAYIFGDGLANVFYPTNAGLLVALNLAETDYHTFMKTGWKLALMLFVATCLILMFGLSINYGF